MNTDRSPTPSAGVRLAHFSDIHVAAVPPDWRPADWMSKRLTGWLKLRCFGRGARFRHAEAVVTALAEDLRRQRPDRVIFSGDATTLAFEEEFSRAAALLSLNGRAPLAGLAVPGNRDYYTRGVTAAGLFERAFAPWQSGRRVDEAVYPFAQRVGPLWLIGVNSCTGNIWPWDAAGSVGPGQLARLEALLAQLDPGPRVLVTHYPVCLAGGEPERPHRQLRDLAWVVDVAVRGGVYLWLHGHRHTAYHVARCGMAPFPVICAGSATQRGRWSYGLYTLAGGRLHAERRCYSPVHGAFETGETFELQLPG
jgi:3',5'-cyclic AMP phosphodiesterase CpdA